ncbi:MAG: hypothetical protein V7K97_00655 [Nostoc sp.]|uniref:hypothetical protein n=1 Tax=Nostoc sp. TaxID=1180 RepID=UPI002FFB79C4
MSLSASFIDTNVWLYRLFDDNKMEVGERTIKREIAIAITQTEGDIISTQVVNEVSANLLKKAAFNEEQIKTVIQSLYHRCTVVEFNREHPNESLNLFPHPQPLSQRWERGDIILVPRIPKMGEGVRG